MRRLFLLLLLFAPQLALADEADVIVVLRSQETAEESRLRFLTAAQATGSDLIRKKLSFIEDCVHELRTLGRLASE